eukprot:7391517-Prymnesium_polylepis.1
MGQIPSSLLPGDEEGEFQQAAAYCFDAISTFDVNLHSGVHETSLTPDGKLQLCFEDWATLYALYKVALQGPCTSGERPNTSPTMQEGWSAWRALGDMSENEAKRSFVRHVRSVLAHGTPLTGAGVVPELEPFEPLSCLLCGVRRSIGRDTRSLPQPAEASAENAPREMQVMHSKEEVHENAAALSQVQQVAAAS